MVVIINRYGTIIRYDYIYRGEEGERIPDEATHITMSEDVTFVRARAFYEHENIREVSCHEGVEKIEAYAFYHCYDLRRVIMPGVKIVEEGAFCQCYDDTALGDVECGKLEIIGEGAFDSCRWLKSIKLPSARIIKDWAFQWCQALVNVECGKLEVIKEGAFDGCLYLSSIDLQSVRIVEQKAFNECHGLTNVKFSSKLERVDSMAFYDCPSLKRITIPLKDNLITCNDIFFACKELSGVDLVEGALHETIAALHLEDWKDDMKQEIDSINQSLPSARPAVAEWDNWQDYDDDKCEKTPAIQTWISSVRDKICHYQTEHQRLLDEAATTLQRTFPRDTVLNNVLPFLELPPHTFVVEERQGEDDSDSGGEEEGDE